MSQSKRPTQIIGYTKSSFTAEMSNGCSVTHDVYTRLSDKDAGVVVIIQELPGIGQETLALADEFVQRGFSVVMPHLFGPLGSTSVLGNTVRVMCLRQEFYLFQSNMTSPIVDWLRALCRKSRDEHNVKGVAVIGMCLTGNFAISLMADDSVLAGYASQPSLPIGNPSALHMSETDIEDIKTALDKKGPMMCGRFAGDWMSTGEKMKTIDKTFNQDGSQRIAINTLPGKGHAIITIDFVDEEGHPTRKALDGVMDYFGRTLAC
ncbi:hypothetical protein SARC_09172 [Sphaeroforma arctica JP610]|uniref:Dienelactone hydrolase domain-containing protein n=1 Tax=Sphaeroforma arctica JP610 TaxID=667725 RepID=A0A0L0FQV4_9EUKA|nr:hypothetical protein SARC_09172 [Sphaeroforma arctica JP610]KNC78393.1 hypothetical protein SARC_09172 [Sphaeroforma arctica JP610]|eukprot:XP_014152295.1 hypothetical protein SARC_09172 [Sphaeroforma arctica JP610]